MTDEQLKDSYILTREVIDKEVNATVGLIVDEIFSLFHTDTAHQQLVIYEPELHTNPRISSLWLKYQKRLARLACAGLKQGKA